MKALSIVVALALVAGQSPTFRSSADAVTVDVLATNGNRPLGGLTAADFEVRDNGVVQSIDSVRFEDVPFNLLLALDTSASVKGEGLRDLQDAARGAVATLAPVDRVSLLTFSEALGGLPDWAPSQPSLGESIEAASAAGATGLYDAAFAALLHTDQEPGRRHLVILFTDGHDTASWLPAPAVLDAASHSDAVVYAVTLEEPTLDMTLELRSGIRLSRNALLVERKPFLPELVARTGGDLFVERGSAKLRQVFERIVTEFRTRYVLTYRPEGVASGGWHSIDVRLKSVTGTVKARRGYQR